MPLPKKQIKQKEIDDDYIEVEGAEFPEMWDWDNNPILIGEYIEKREGNFTSFTIEKNDKQYGIWGAVLNSKFENIPISSMVKIEYLGYKGSGRNRYRDFSVKRKK